LALVLTAFHVMCPNVIHPAVVRRMSMGVSNIAVNILNRTTQDPSEDSLSESNDGITLDSVYAEVLNISKEVRKLKLAQEENGKSRSEDIQLQDLSNHRRNKSRTSSQAEF